ncbi:hypothetical protein MSG28_008248 [Choristoneura fumiferana]|uniref:Uncharacterized protein n=1 Tax=Choristoneura fumiferana TaxID=7141 RepID=A0ACC0JAL3_CHOFU|nr:hypothetical protein MSG28_008248 [Choristoneura fumiferana]
MSVPAIFQRKIPLRHTKERRVRLHKHRGLVERARRERPRARPGAALRGADPAPPAPPAPERGGFRQFLQGHIDLAFGEGFDDNVGKYAMSTSFFELPSAWSWRAAAQALEPLYSAEAQPEEGGGALHDALATDVRFSQARCAKVLPIAQASYAEGLPAHYSSQHHAHKVNVALGVLHAMGRGPVAGAARARLRAACAAAWRTRSLCEAPSLTNHPCIHPDHDSSKEHSSGVRYISACNCGRSKCSREDPYSVRAANCAFYAGAAHECAVCPTLLAVALPVFTPSTPSYRAASVKGESQEAEAETRASDGNSGDSAWSAPDALSPGSAAGSDASPQYLVPVRGSNTEKVMTRQPSTTEYLPGMLHTLSPAGLLPAFASWSLVVSRAFLAVLAQPRARRAPAARLPAAHQLPAAVGRACAHEQVAAWRVAQATRAGAAGSRRPAPPHRQDIHRHRVRVPARTQGGCWYTQGDGNPRFNTRFMMSSPDTVVNGGGGACGRSAGARLAAADMPLYAPCLCRSASTMLAQLTRVHVVTPKAPVHVTLDPKVQPVLGGPIFVPQPVGSPPLELTASAYWVLRLPHTYADERGPLPRPRAPAASGLLLAPLFGLRE